MQQQINWHSTNTLIFFLEYTCAHTKNRFTPESIVTHHTMSNEAPQFMNTTEKDAEIVPDEGKIIRVKWKNESEKERERTRNRNGI